MEKVTLAEAEEAWRIVKEHALGDRQPFVTSDQIRKLDAFFAQKSLTKNLVRRMVRLLMGCTDHPIQTCESWHATTVDIIVEARRHFGE